MSKADARHSKGSSDRNSHQREQDVLKVLDRLMILVGITSTILGESTVKGILERAVEGALAVTDAGIAASGHGLQEGNLTFGAVAHEAEISPCPTNVTFTMERGGVYTELLKDRSSIRLTEDELVNHPAWWGLPPGHAPLKGLLGARLEDSPGQAGGMILVSHSRHGEFSAEDEAMLTQLCLLTSLAIRHTNARTTLEKQTEQLKETDKILRDSEERFREVFAHAPVGMVVLDPTGRYLDVNEAYCHIVGYDAREILHEDFTFHRVTHPADLKLQEAEFDRMLQGKIPSFFMEKRNVRKDGSIMWVRLSVSARRNGEGKPIQLICLVEDIHARKETEEALRISESNYRTIFDSANDCFFIQCARSGQILDVNQKVLEMYKYTHDELVQLDVGQLSETAAGYTQERAMELAQLAASGTPQLFEWLARAKDGQVFWVEVSLKKVVLSGEDRLLAVVRDISERKKGSDALKESEERLRVSEERLSMAQSAAGIGMWNVNLHTGESTFSEKYLELLGMDRPPQSFEEFVSHIHPEDCDTVIRITDDAVAACGNFEAEFRINWRKGFQRWIMGRGAVFCDGEGARRMTGVVFDITDRKLAEEKLKEAMEELARSNRELEQFAYVASHDLQEPLRMVSGYVKLLARKYMDRLDPMAETYIRFAVDGADRMQNLIEGLLAYSRISRETALHAVDTNVSFSAAVANLAASIEETGAQVTKEKLPVVEGDETQLMQLFQNLISNGLKYHAKGVSPRVHIGVKKAETEWEFAVRDNGIGIPSKDFEKIFQIFHRLHTREEYQGTGIGLASCKKIVERHNGRIWVESAPGEGSTFFFTIPAKREKRRTSSMEDRSAE